MRFISIAAETLGVFVEVAVSNPCLGQIPPPASQEALLEYFKKASSCSIEIWQKAVDLKSDRTLKAFSPTDVEGSPANQRARTWSVPMVVATALDHGEPGSAWEACVSR